jgi:hypothetical protein
MKAWPLARCWLLVGSLLNASACQDRPLNLLPDSQQPVATGGGAQQASGGAGGGAGSSPASAGSNGGGLAASGSDANGGGGVASAGAEQGGVSNNGGTAGRAGMAGAGGGIPCQTDADCAPPTPGCSPLMHVCKQCSKSSQCPNGLLCSVDDGECGN